MYCQEKMPGVDEDKQVDAKLSKLEISKFYKDDDLHISNELFRILLSSSR